MVCVFLLKLVIMGYDPFDIRATGILQQVSWEPLLNKLNEQMKDSIPFHREQCTLFEQENYGPSVQFSIVFRFLSYIIMPDIYVCVTHQFLMHHIIIHHPSVMADT